jgi:LuxR family transcriptional regulator
MDKLAGIRGMLEDIQRLCGSGYAIALHIRFTTPRFLFQTYPRRWTDVYSAKGLVMHDPTVRWGLEHVGRIDWADLGAFDPADVIGQARAEGILHGFTLATTAGDSRSIGSFSRGDRPFAADELDRLGELFGRLHAETAAVGDEALLRDLLRQLSVDLTHI